MRGGQVLLYNILMEAFLQSCSLHFNKYGLLHVSKDGLKAKKNLAQSNALGTVDHLFCALKEQKEGEREDTY